MRFARPFSSPFAFLIFCTLALAGMIGAPSAAPFAAHAQGQVAARDGIAFDAYLELLKARARAGAGGLVPDETHFLNALQESVESGQAPADELLAQYHSAWEGDVTRVFGEYSY